MLAAGDALARCVGRGGAAGGDRDSSFRARGGGAPAGGGRGVGGVLPHGDWQALPKAEQARRRDEATATLRDAGADYVIDSVADLMPVLERIGQRIAA